MSLTDSELKIGYMPLAHDVYWEFFPQFEAHTIELAQTYRDYLAQFGTIHETGKLIDCPDRSREARQLFQARDIDFGYDPTTMFTTFGVATVPVLDSVVLAAFEAVDETEVESLAAEMSERYTIADEFQGKELTNSMRLAHAVRRLVDENNLAAVTVYCQSMWQRPEIGVVPCLGLSLLMQQGTFCSCEGDVPTALSGLILEQFAGTAVFTEIWCNDFANDQFMMGHSGTINLGLFEGSEERVQINRHPWWDGCCGRGACLQVKMHPGEVTLLSLTEVPDAGWRMIVTTAQIVDRDPVPLGAPNFFIKLGKPITEFLEDLGELAAAHHFAMAYGNQTQDLQALAKLLGVEYCEI